MRPTELEQLLNITPRPELNAQTTQEDMREVLGEQGLTLAEGIEAAERLDFERMVL